MPKKKDKPKRVVSARISDEAWKWFEMFASNDDRDKAYWVSRFIEDFVAVMLRTQQYKEEYIEAVIEGVSMEEVLQRKASAANPGAPDAQDPAHTASPKPAFRPGAAPDPHIELGRHPKKSKYKARPGEAGA